jgi:hypothetical protein
MTTPERRPSGTRKSYVRYHQCVLGIIGPKTVMIIRPNHTDSSGAGNSSCSVNPVPSAARFNPEYFGKVMCVNRYGRPTRARDRKMTGITAHREVSQTKFFDRHHEYQYSVRLGKRTKEISCLSLYNDVRQINQKETS